MLLEKMNYKKVKKKLPKSFCLAYRKLFANESSKMLKKNTKKILKNRSKMNKNLRSSCICCSCSSQDSPFSVSNFSSTFADFVQHFSKQLVLSIIAATGVCVFFDVVVDADADVRRCRRSRRRPVTNKPFSRLYSFPSDFPASVSHIIKKPPFRIMLYATIVAFIGF